MLTAHLNMPDSQYQVHTFLHKRGCCILQLKRVALIVAKIRRLAIVQRQAERSY